MSETMRVICESVRRALPASTGFAIFLSVRAAPESPEPGAVLYGSNADRVDMRKTAAEWIAKQKAAVSLGVPPAPNDRSPTSRAARTALERKCFALGEELARELRPMDIDIAIFLFDFGDRGNLAWWTSPEAPWLASLQRFADGES